MVLNVEEHAGPAIGVRQVCFLPIHEPNQWWHRKAESQIPSGHRIGHLHSQLEVSVFQLWDGQGITSPGPQMIVFACSHCPFDCSSEVLAESTGPGIISRRQAEPPSHENKPLLFDPAAKFSFVDTVNKL